ncbi:hypothetical protein IGI04_027713 [Brassica rapa subsp. trilocularis]|uniref:Uncharacterized protein n=1 Tax=Brassica rapa subsp. trilocularis TaxID=1813537 RepID=A0ABQ7L285_BRACM|nr:hypothetical protein IGI04_027713 [Brassica rapa subsp. trilocularis]
MKTQNLRLRIENPHQKSPKRSRDPLTGIKIRLAKDNYRSNPFDYKGLIQAIISDHRSVELFGVLADIDSFINSSFLLFQAFFIPRSSIGLRILMQRSFYVPIF